MAAAQQNAPRPPRNDALERLHVCWLVSTIALALVAVLVIVYVRGALARYSTQVNELRDTVQTLDETVAELSNSLEQLQREQQRQPREHAAGDRGTPDESRAPRSEPLEIAALPPADSTIPSETEIQRQLNQILAPDAATPADVADLDAAQTLVQQAVEQRETAPWTGQTWASLAVLARLSGLDDQAATLAGRAADTGGSLEQYAEVTFRALLARDDVARALDLTEDLAKRGIDSDAIRVLVAAARLRAGQQAAADRAVDTISDITALKLYDRLILARVLLSLEDWNGLAALLSLLRSVDPRLAHEVNYLQAIPLARAGQTAAALALLDYLAAHPSEPETDWGAWPVPAPSPYEIETSRGATLVQAGQLDAARDVLLQAVSLSPDEPTAFYYLGLLEQRAGRPNAAREHLENAVARRAQMAAAWEALALLALEAQDVEAALTHIEQALEANPRRASAYFMQALLNAKVTRREATAAALREAFRYDPTYVEEAKQADVIRRLISTEEIDDLAAEAMRPAPDAAPAENEPA
jgi:tetratricopeptide (TPR) repeat protein